MRCIRCWLLAKVHPLAGGVSLRALAFCVGVNESALDRYECGLVARPSMSVLILCAEHLERSHRVADGYEERASYEQRRGERTA